MNVFSTVYVLYFLFTISVIHLMARSLSRTSRTFLLEAFHGNSDRTSLVNRVIIASFFLANVGFVVSEAPTGTSITRPRVRLSRPCSKGSDQRCCFLVSPCSLVCGYSRECAGSAPWPQPPDDSRIETRRNGLEGEKSCISSSATSFIC